MSTLHTSHLKGLGPNLFDVGLELVLTMAPSLDTARTCLEKLINCWQVLIFSPKLQADTYRISPQTGPKNK